MLKIADFGMAREEHVYEVGCHVIRSPTFTFIIINIISALPGIMTILEFL